MATEFLNELGNELLPIREISRTTGINTVTLRAWERRYGLLVPQRTAKGHRLYTKADIQKVRQIQVWLARGVAISKVPALLAEKATGDLTGQIDSAWTGIAEQIHEHLNNFHRSRLEHLLADIFALYPAEIVADYVLIPLIEQLQGDLVGQAAKRAFFSSVLQEYLQAIIYRQRQAVKPSNKNPKLLLVSLSQNAGFLESLLLEYSMLVRQCDAEFFGNISAKEVSICIEALQANIVVLLGYGFISAGDLQLFIKTLREKSAIPIVVAGSSALICPALHFPSDAAVYSGVASQQVHSIVGQLLDRGEEQTSFKE